jgi:hypothetical protein
VEIAEIGREEGWTCWVSDGRPPKWFVEALVNGNVVRRRVGNFTERKDAKAAATLPELVRQRDRLLEAAKAVVPLLISWGSAGHTQVVLVETIAKIEKNPLIRLADAE